MDKTFGGVGFSLLAYLYDNNPLYCADKAIGPAITDWAVSLT